MTLRDMLVSCKGNGYKLTQNLAKVPILYRTRQRIR